MYSDKNDQIILIGFSRGSYTIQCLAQLINDVGLIQRGSVDKELPKIFYLWKKESNRSSNGPLQLHIKRLNEEAEKQDDLHKEQRVKVRYPDGKTNIKIFAAWDNVASLKSKFFGIHEKEFDFVGSKLPQNISKAYHALALDEKRKNFKPVLFTTDKEDQLLQCWFRGSHGDIGGGCENAGLANLSLCWIISKLRDDINFTLPTLWDLTKEGTIVKEKEAQIIGVENITPSRGRGRCLVKISDKSVRAAAKESTSLLGH